MLKRFMAALVAVSMVWLTGCAGGMMAGPRPGYYDPHYSPNAVTRVTARNMATKDELIGLVFPGYGNPAYYGYGFNNPYAWGGYDWAYGSGRWNYRRHQSREIWTAVGAGALGFLLGRVTAPKHKNTEVQVAPTPPVEAPVEMGCYSIPLINLTGVSVFVGDHAGEGFIVKAGQTVQACLLPTDCAWRKIGNNLVPVTFVREGNAIVIR